jgi:hypothetical protein
MQDQTFVESIDSIARTQHDDMPHTPAPGTPGDFATGGAIALIAIMRLADMSEGKGCHWVTIDPTTGRMALHFYDLDRARNAALRLALRRAPWVQKRRTHGEGPWAGCWAGWPVAVIYDPNDVAVGGSGQ